jgi:bifunctional non-homologous end joining protein LigD
MDDKLQRYRQKRDFGITSEPQGGRANGKQLSFVIQKHAARRLHYDFRLELDGTLLSWAVPKGPSLDPADKRMAVHVEDHPLDYGGFEGTIPPGQYGAGTVIVWDRGTWEPLGDPRAGYRDGKLKFELKGEKLAGHWTLVRMRGRGEKQEPWLLIKERDDAVRLASEYSVVDELPDSVLASTTSVRTEVSKSSRPSSARADPSTGSGQGSPRGELKSSVPATDASNASVKAKLPLALSPQLATLVDAAPKDDNWIYELKFDGYRLLARIEGEGAKRDVKLFTRNGHDWTSKMKGLAKDLKALPLKSGWIDGEIVVHGPSGAPDFQLLQNAFDSSRTENIQFFVFDLPYADGLDLRQVPLVERRERLRKMLDGAAGRIHYSEDFQVSPQDLLHTACQMQMEGLIGKRRDASYSTGRSPSWIKLKCTQRQEFVIGGYTDPKGSRTGLGALMLGVHDEAGKLRYAGNVGTGFNAKTLALVSEKLGAIHADRAPFDPLPKGVKGHWVKPKLIAEVSFAQWTKDGHVRHAVFHGLRGDKAPRGITVEKPQKVIAVTKAATQEVPKKATKASTSKPSFDGLKLTHPERVIDASTGITKLELAEYYARAASKLLPHLKNRPVSLVRAPDGIGGELFFQKHAQHMKFPGITLLPAELDRDHDPLLEVSTREALMGCVQMNVVELHTWNAFATRIEQPDRMTFDLDPGDGVAWARMQEAAALIRALLEELQLDALLKTSGGKGLHVVVPFAPKWDWDTVKSLSQTVVVHLAQTLPQLFVAKSGPKNRVGKIFVDYLRNGRGATTASAWTARARPGMGVSVPVDWSELDSLTSGAHWTIRSVDERLSLEEPWGGALKSRQTLTAAMRALDFVPARAR